MPALPTDHHYEMRLHPADGQIAESALEGWRRFICFYCANRGTVTRWGGWTPERWAELARLLTGAFDLDGVVLLGADWDRGFADGVRDLLPCPCVDLVGKLPLGGTLRVLLRARYLVAFPSGIPILATALRVPTMMFYPAHLERMQTAWAPPEMIESGAYKGCQFCAPAKAFDWIMSRPQLKRRLSDVD